MLKCLTLLQVTGVRLLEAKADKTEGPALADIDQTTPAAPSDCSPLCIPGFLNDHTIPATMADATNTDLNLTRLPLLIIPGYMHDENMTEVRSCLALGSFFSHNLPRRSALEILQASLH